MKTVTMSFGRSVEFRREMELSRKERTAIKSHPAGRGRRLHQGRHGLWFVQESHWDVTFQTWPNRASMAKSIRMQQQREYRNDDWRALVPLTDIEGY